MQYVWQTRDNLTTGHSYNFESAQTADPLRLGNTGNPVASSSAWIAAAINVSQPAVPHGVCELGLYAQDEWKLMPKLTLNLGIRFDHYSVPHLTAGMNNGFDHATG